MQMKNEHVVTNVAWSFQKIWGYDRLYFFLSLLDGFFRGLLPVVILVITQKLLNLLQMGEKETAPIVEIVAAISGMQILESGAGAATRALFKNSEIQFQTDMQTEILEKAERLSCKQFENSEMYDILNRVQYDAGNSILGNFKGTVSLLNFIIGGGSYLAIVGGYSWMVMLVMVAIPFLQFRYERLYNLQEFHASLQNTEKQRRASYISWLLLSPESVKEIKMYRLFHKFTRQFVETHQQYDSLRMKINRKRGRTDFLCMLVNALADFLITAVLALKTMNGLLLLGQFVLYSNSIAGLKNNTANMLHAVADIYNNASSTDIIRRFYSLEEEDSDPWGEKISDIETIRLEHVGYRYSGTSETLQDVNLTLTAGDFILLLGENGSGKTTLLKILMGIYTDYTGEIFINGINLRKIDMESYRQRVAVLFQNFNRYETTIFDNIVSGMEGKDSVSASSVTRMLAEMNMQELIPEMNEPLGCQFEKGRQLSAGQWQKLAVMRCLVKDADLRILDEPNAALDIPSEEKFFKQIHRYRKNGIVVMTLHKYTGYMGKPTEIIVLNHGRIQERGSHEALMENKGFYYKFLSAKP